MSIIPRELRSVPDRPVTFTVSSRRRRRDEFEAGDTYSDFEVAKEFADELADHHRRYQAVVFNSRGVKVYDTRNRSNRA
jgi:hypothetical protein